MSGLRNRAKPAQRLRPTSSDPRLSALIENQPVENWDVRMLDAYHDALDDPKARYAAETFILLLRMSRWAANEGKSPDWAALDDEYGGMSPPAGVDRAIELVMRSLKSIVGFKAYNYPRLQDDLFAYGSVVKDISDGAEGLTESSYYVETQPNLLVIVAHLLTRLENESGWTSEQVQGIEQTEEFENQLVEEGRERVLAVPETGWGSHLGIVVDWYLSLDDPVATYAQVMGTVSGMLVGLDKNSFIQRLAPNLHKLPGLPNIATVLSPMAYGEEFLMGRYGFSLGSGERMSWQMKLRQDRPLTFNVRNEDTGMTDIITMSSSQLYATILNFVLICHTPGAEDETWFGEDDSFWSTSWRGPAVPEG